MTVLDVLAGGAAGLAGFFAFAQAAMTSTPQFGWLARHWLVRGFMGAVGITMIARCLTSLAFGQGFNPIGALVVFGLAALFFVELLDVVVQSWRGRAAEVERLAAEPKLAARRLVFQRLRRQDAAVRQVQATAASATSELERIRRETAWLRAEAPPYTEITRLAPPSHDD